MSCKLAISWLLFPSLKAYKLILVTCLLSTTVDALGAPLKQSLTPKFFAGANFDKVKSVTDIVEDQYGFIWIATSTGLFKYDGKVLTAFKANPKAQKTLPSHIINTLHISSQNNLLIGTSSGLSQYSYETNDFSSIPFSRHEESPPVTDIIQSNHGDYWIATGNSGVFILDSKLGFKRQLTATKDDKNSLHNDIVISLLEDSLGNIWIGTKDGLNKYANTTRQVTKLPPPIKMENAPSKIVYGMFELNSSQIVISFFDHSFTLNPTTDSYSQFPIDASLLSSELINTIIVDNKSNYYIGTKSEGLTIIDNKINSASTYTSSNSSNSNLISNSIKTLFIDSYGHLWIGTTVGLQALESNSPTIELYRQQQNDLKCLSGNESYSVLANKSDLYIGYVGGAFNHINFDRKTCNIYGSKYENSKYKLDFITSFDIDEEGNIWLGNISEGLIKFNPQNGTLSKPNVDSLHFQNLIDKSLILDVLIDSNKIWMALYSQGTAFYDLDKKEVTSYQHIIEEHLGLTDIGTQTIAKQNDIIWLGTQTNGLISIDLSSKQVKQHKTNELPSNIITVVADKDILWIGTAKKGFYKFNPELNTINNFQESEGLSQNSVWAINKDDQERLWLTTSNGISIFDIRAETFTNISTEDGLQSLEGTGSGSFDFHNRALWTGGINGINRIDTANFKHYPRLPETIINSIKINNMRITISPKIGNYNLGTLKPDQNTIGFTFLAKEIIRAYKSKHRYRLNGDVNWTYTDSTENNVTFGNLTAGHYIFEVQSSLDNQWNSPITTLYFDISKHWYHTHWAYFIFSISSIMIIYLFSYFRNKALTKRAKYLEKQVNNRTLELSKEKQKVEQLLSSKNDEFANLSHEFRTPLTLILGPINQLVTKSKDKNLVGKLNIVQRNALRLLRMVDQLLNLETFRVKSITQKSPQAIGKITQLVAEAFADLAEEKQITFNIETIEPVCFDFTPDAFEKIILNLLSNAIKYTKPGGTITVCTTRIEQAQYQIRVSDTGIGIAKDKLEKVFERFNRVMDENSEQVTGSGIGLALVKSLVESHDGSVELESELGQGTTITVTLPIINEVDESQINVHQNDEIIAMELMNVSSSGMHESSIAQTAEAIQSTGKPTVLVIEDNDDMRQYIVESIGQQFNTLVAADGQAGLELAIQEVPDLIISDIMMPKLDGYQTTKALREAQITNHIPVVLLTARGDRDSRLKGWEEKADEYITKPFDVEELIIRISNLIEIRNILKRRFSETVFEQTEQAPESLVQEMDGDSGNLSIVEINTQKLQQEFINQLNQQIESVYMNAELGVIDLAKSVNMSERQFYRKLKSVIDMTPSEYLRRFRLEKSKEVLRSGKTANFTAFEVGFSSQAYFSKCFKAQYNLTPKQFVNQK